MIRDYIKLLRRAADILEEIISFSPLSNEALSAKEKIHANMDRQQIKIKKVKKRKKYKLKKLHWTKRPENKAKVLAMRRKGTKTLKANHEAQKI